MTLFYIILALLITLILYLYLFFVNRYKYFQRKGVPYVKPFLIFGNMMESILMKKSVNDLYYEIHKQLEGHRFGGIFMFATPVFFIRDPELYNTISTTDFVHFEDRIDNGIQSNESFKSKILVYLKGEEWRTFRKKLVCTTSAKKMTMILPFITKCCENFVKAFEKLCTEEDFNPDDVCNRFMLDIGISTILGSDISTLENPDTEYLPFLRNILKVRPIKLLLFKIGHIPKFLINLVNLTGNEEKNDKKFRDMILQNLSFRKQNKIVQNDFLEFFAEINEKINDDEVTKEQNLLASTTTFLKSGLIITAAILSGCLAELSADHNAQNKLRMEINEMWDGNEKLTLDKINKMNYLDMIFCETLRRRAMHNNRQCTKTYRIPRSDVIIPKGSSIVISYYALHMDEKYYEKPKEFYPEHFTDEAKKNRPKWAFVPFGNGPRFCIGSRVATMEIKLALIYIIKNFEFDVSPKMQKPVDTGKFYLGTEKNRIPFKMVCRKI